MRTRLAGLVLAGCQPKSDSANGKVPSRSAGVARSISSGSALGALAKLAVKPDGPISGYDRIADFGAAWTDGQGASGGHNGCETRDDILRRDLTEVKLEGRCEVESGVLKDPCTGRTIRFTRGRKTSPAVRIDHMVALGNAWQTGAKALSKPVREQLANDPLNLTAADGPANDDKGDDDASGWLPQAAAGFRCEYVARQVAVETKYKLWITPAEKTAMSRTLGGCRGQVLPTESSHEVALKS
ncbi:HNH endonuclease family protein [Streptomyces sp. NPDC088910]|uniref:HNH endonuclease family protein n=1 Tax=Streptomyces sp. NPDC088910 TaxID=3365911 RepID=UPI0037F2C7C7